MPFADFRTRGRTEKDARVICGNVPVARTIVPGVEFDGQRRVDADDSKGAARGPGSARTQRVALKDQGSTVSSGRVLRSKIEPQIYAERRGKTQPLIKPSVARLVAKVRCEHHFPRVLIHEGIADQRERCRSLTEAAQARFPRTCEPRLVLTARRAAISRDAVSIIASLAFVESAVTARVEGAERLGWTIGGAHRVGGVGTEMVGGGCVQTRQRAGKHARAGAIGSAAICGRRRPSCVPAHAARGDRAVPVTAVATDISSRTSPRP